MEYDRSNSFHLIYTSNLYNSAYLEDNFASIVQAECVQKTVSESLSLTQKYCFQDKDTRIYTP